MPVAYSWGFNNYGQCCLSEPSSEALEDAGDAGDFALGNVVMPCEVILPKGEEESVSNIVDYCQKSEHHTKKKTRNGDGGNNIWNVWEKQNGGGGFVFRSAYMVYGNNDNDNGNDDNTDINYFIDVSCSNFHSAVITNTHTLLSGGWNGHLQLGVDSLHVNDDRCCSLEKVTGLNNEKIVSVACGGYHTVCSTIQGRVFTWGDGTKGQLGYSQFFVNDDHENNRKPGPRRSSKFTKQNQSKFCNAKPTAVSDLYNIKSVSAGFDHTYVLSRDGKVLSFGSNEYGQLGLGKIEESCVFSPMNVKTCGLINSVAAGDYHALFLSVDGSVMACGNPSFGRLGCIGKNVLGLDRVDIPQRIDYFLKEGIHIERICAGGGSSAGITASNLLYLWGYNEAGNLGLGSTNSIDVPSRNNYFKIHNHSIIDVSLGEDHSVFLSEEKMIFTSGKTSCGRLGVSKADCTVDEVAIVDNVEETVEEGDEDAAILDAASEDDTSQVIEVVGAVSNLSFVMENVGERFVDSISNAFVNDAPLVSSPLCIGMLFDEEDEEVETIESANAVNGVASGGAHNFAFRCTKERYANSGNKSLLVNCRNKEVGCQARLLNSLIEKHEAICRFKTRNCIYCSFGCQEMTLLLADAESHEASCEFRQPPEEDTEEKDKGSVADAQEDVQEVDAAEEEILEEEKEDAISDKPTVADKPTEVETQTRSSTRTTKCSKPKPKPLRRQSTAKRTGGGFALT